MKPRTDPSTKPYFRCLSCSRFRKGCGGIPTRDMDLQNWCEYMRDVKDMVRLTNSVIAKEADVSIGTIERIMAINIDQDIRRATARRIELAIIGSVGAHTCYLDYNDGTAAERIEKLTSENTELKNKLERIDELHRNDIRIIREEHKEEIAFLKEQLRAWQSRDRRD